MKKLIIILSILLASCTANVGDLREQTLIITESNIHSWCSRKNGVEISKKSAIYTARSYNGASFVDNIKFTDDIGKYKVGDTIKIVKW